MTRYLLNYWPVVVLAALSLLIVWPLILPGYFSHHDDLQVMRIFEMRRCILDLQIPCRWVSDMGYGNGFPLFNYYGVFPYYIGALLSFLVGFIGAAKILFFIPLIFGGISMYLLGKELFGKVPGLTAGILYLFAPYRALDSYVRGAVAESFSLALVPIVFYFFLKLIKERKLKNFLAAAVSLSLLLTTHNIMNLLFIPLLLVFIAILLFINHCKNIIPIALSLLLGFILAAYFIIPAYFEQSLVQTDTLTRFDLDFRVHFVTAAQLFLNRSWGYGPSILGPNDTMSFQIGWPLWWLVIFVPIAGFLNKFKNKKIKSGNYILASLFLMVFIFSVFMTHNKSAFIWEKIGILRFAQFPWRFLSLSIFSASLLGGFAVLVFNGRIQKIITAIIILAAVFLNWNFFKPEHFFTAMNDQEKLSGISWQTQQKAAILDYLPKTAVEPREVAPKEPIVISGRASTYGFDNKSDSWQFNATVEKLTNMEIPIFDFPIWQVMVNGQKFQHSHQNLLGRIRLDLPPGNYHIEGKFTNTPIRTFANNITFISILILIGIIFYGKYKKIFK